MIILRGEHMIYVIGSTSVDLVVQANRLPIRELGAQGGMPYRHEIE